MAEEKSPERTRLNSILLFITLGVLAFIGGTSWNNSMTLAKMEGAQMTRVEVETKLSEIKASVLAAEKEIAQINLELIKLQARPAK